MPDSPASLLRKFWNAPPGCQVSLRRSEKLSDGTYGWSAWIVTELGGVTGYGRTASAACEEAADALAKHETHEAKDDQRRPT
ncbi:MAG: hypothetical protein V2A79_14810 [Planctomycetota bacterium]